MGYDMSWCETPPGEAEAVAAARLAFKQACERRDAITNTKHHDFVDGTLTAMTDEQRAVEAAMEVMYAAERSYFRLNIWGMSTAREELWKAGVLVEAEHDPWPELADFGLAEYPENEPGSYLENSSERRFLTESARIRSQVAAGDVAGIAMHKVCSNDGWHVTPGEITVAMAKADAENPGWRDQLTDYVRDFVTWMEESVEHGGFKVY